MFLLFQYYFANTFFLPVYNICQYYCPLHCYVTITLLLYINVLLLLYSIYLPIYTYICRNILVYTHEHVYIDKDIFAVIQNKCVSILRYLFTTY